MRITWVGARSVYSVGLACAAATALALFSLDAARGDNEVDPDAAATSAPDSDSAAAPSVDDTAPTAEMIDADIAPLIEQLDADRFAQRQAATQKLLEVGRRAIPALIEAAASDSREVSGRAVEILKKHATTGDDETKASAKAALEKIAAGDNVAAATRAREALTPKEEPALADRNLQQFVPGRIRIQVRALGGQGARRIRVSNVNGVKDIEVHDGERSVKIHDDPANGIKMEVTQKKDGKEVTEKFEAKDAADLKKNHPEAHKIYEEFSKGTGGIQIRGNGGIQIRAVPVPDGVPLPRGVPIPGGAPIPMPVPGGAPAVPGAGLPPGAIPPGAVPPGAIPALPLPADGAARAAILEQLQRNIDEVERQARKLAENSPDDKNLAELLERLQEARHRLQAQAPQPVPEREDGAAP